MWHDFQQWFASMITRGNNETIVFIIVWLGVMLVGFAGVFLITRKPTAKKESKLATYALCLGLCFISGLIVSALIIALILHPFQRVPARHVVFDPGHTIQYIARDKMMWKSELQGCKIFPVKWEDIVVEMSTWTTSDDLRVKDSNFKIRKLSYTVIIDARNINNLPPELYWQRWEDQANYKHLAGIIQDIVTDKLYELNERENRKLGRFYNPSSPKQQARFRQLIEPAVEKTIPDWLEVKEILFSLP